MAKEKRKYSGMIALFELDITLSAGSIDIRSEDQVQSGRDVMSRLASSQLFGHSP
jgi:hypothetical protein